MISANSKTQDFNRDVWCLFGLPVDNLTMASAKALLYEKTAARTGAVLSTININWIVQSLQDSEFRDAILNSDIITLDGKPLLWLAKLLGLPMTELISGSTLIEELQQRSNGRKPLSLFLFGGEKDIARKALEKVNANRAGLFAAGALNPGFGTIQEMSQVHVIDQINETEPDILLVALGAKKGARWIEVNRKRLKAGIISHLGATINFLAQNVRRAPVIMRNLGLEWVWRILQEPKLFNRYLNDGLFMLKWLARHLILWCHFLRLKRAFRNEAADQTVLRFESTDEITLQFGRKLEMQACHELRALFGKCAHAGKHVTFDFKKTEFVDGSFLGLCIILMKYQFNARRNFSMTHVNRNLKKIFRLFGMMESMQKLGFEVHSQNDVRQIPMIYVRILKLVRF
jgi:N-acetylglucosaminyldiphosphoundecaprenol N-acetyl-beta-D-mannosaminyltransferase